MAEVDQGRDRAELRDRFEAELRVAGLQIPSEDDEALFAMWEGHLPHREALRGAALAPEEEPTFIERPTAGGGA